MSIDATQSTTEKASNYTPKTGSTTFITTSGGLLTEQLVSKLRQRQCEESAVCPETFTLPSEEPPAEAELEDRVGEAWDSLRERWDELTMDNELFGMDVSDARNKWMLKYFQQFDFHPVYQRENLTASGIEANLSHKGWPDEGISQYGEMEGRTAPVLHTVEPDQKLDEKPEDAPRGAKSPHDTLQEFLNASDDHDWGIVTNGLTLRVLRDYYHTYTRGYVEFDLENMFTNRNYGDFRALHRLFHASRFIEPVVADEEDEEVVTPLEQLYQVALSTGVKVGKDLQSNVVNALETLGNGFLNPEIEATLEEGGEDAADDYYQDLLYVVYRLLFLLFAEQRGMMSQRDSLYTEEYSITKLRERAEQREEGDRNTDLWEGLKATFHLASEGNKRLGVPSYNGGLFDDNNLEYILEAECPNEKLLSAVDDLTHIEQEGYRQRISYADLGVEEIGAVYESLLEFTPQVAETVIELEDRTISTGLFFLDDRGMDRKETGSFYTDPELVDELIQSALKPVVEDRVDDAASTEVKEQQLLDISVCDPAAGSGAFLIAANNFLGQKLAEIRSDSLYPDERTIRQARRTVVQHCLYGVDLNQMAVELAKVSLWINSAVEDKPLSFLDHRIKQGNSLIGTTPSLISQGIPVDAYETSKGRDWHKGNEVRKQVRTQNKELEEREHFQGGLGWEYDQQKTYVDIAKQLEQLDEQSIGDIHRKQELYEELQNSLVLNKERLIHDVWTSAFYWPLDGSLDEYPSLRTIERLKRNIPESSNTPIEELSGLQQLREKASRTAEEESFFHWPLEFPIVYNDGGFDCILGNPPWEKIEVEEDKFFAVRDPEIANAGTTAKRKQAIEELENSNPELYDEYQTAIKRANQQVKFIHESGRYPLTGKGNINTFAVFSELALEEVNSNGQSGIIVPTAIGTGSRTQKFFQEIVESRRLRSLFDFVNKEGLFEDVHKQFKFALLTLSGEEWDNSEFEFAFSLTAPEQLRREEVRYCLSKDDIVSINPNTKTCPAFESRADAELVLKLHNTAGVLINEKVKGGNPWGIDWGSVFNMSHDSEHFHTKSELDSGEWKMNDNEFENGEKKMIPLYESKLIYQYNHRFATFEHIPLDEAEDGHARNMTVNELDDERKSVIPRYWVPEGVYEEKNGRDWHLALRSITNPTNKRTVIGSIIPGTAAGHSLNLMKGPTSEESLLLLSALNSFALDFVARQKLSGTNLSNYLMKQLPVPSPDRFQEVKLDGRPVEKDVKDHVGMLVYTANDLSTFASQGDIQGPNQYSGEEREREDVRLELEAIMCHIFGLELSDLDRLFSSFEQIENEEYKEYGYYQIRDEIKERFEELAPRITDLSGGER